MSPRDYVTFRVEGQLFGVDAAFVQDVFNPRGLTPVPLARREIAGVLNLRGRIVTAVCARSVLSLPPRDEDGPEAMAVGVEIGGDSYGLIVDNVDEVLKLDVRDFVPPPGALPARWAELVAGVCGLKDELLIVLDVGKLLDFGLAQAA
jgi:purine-binding chemotaxis protein CheW